MELIAFDSTLGPASSKSQEFALEPLESKLLLTKPTEQLIRDFHTSSSAQAAEALQLSGHFIHVTAVIKRHGNSQSDGMTDMTDCKAMCEMESEAQTTGSKGSRLMKGWLTGDWSVVRLLQTSVTSLHQFVTSASWQGPGERGEQSCSGNCVKSSIWSDTKMLVERHCGHDGKDTLLSPNRVALECLTECPDPKVLDDLAAAPMMSEADVFLTEFRDAHVMPMPNITAAHFRLLSPYMIQFVVSSNAVAPYVAVECEMTGRFSNNNFILNPWQPRTIAFLSEQPLYLTVMLDRNFSFLSLADTTLQL